MRYLNRSEYVSWTVLVDRLGPSDLIDWNKRKSWGLCFNVDQPFGVENGIGVLIAMKGGRFGLSSETHDDNLVLSGW